MQNDFKNQEIQLILVNFYVVHNSRRLFFIQLAHDVGFDYKDPEGWYTVSSKHVLYRKVVFNVTYYRFFLV